MKKISIVLILAITLVISGIPLSNYNVTAKTSNQHKPQSFSAEIQPSGTSKDLYSVSFSNVFHGFVGGLNETLISTYNSGGFWHIDHSGGTGSYDEIEMVNDSFWYIGASHAWGRIPRSDYPDLKGMHWDGWIDKNGTPHLGDDISELLMTYDGGKNWEEVFVPTNFRITGTNFFNPDFGVVVTCGNGHPDSDTWFTSDHGNHWRLTRSEDWATWTFLAVQMMDKDTWKVFGYPFAMYWNASQPSYIRDKVFSSYDIQIMDGHFLDYNDGWAIGFYGLSDPPDHGQFMETNDGGWNWTYHNVTDGAYLTSLCRISPTEAWAVGSLGTIIHTVDSGITWTPVSSPTTKTLNDVYFPDPNFGWAVGESGTIVFIHNRTPPHPPDFLAYVDVSPSSPTLKVGQTIRLTATGYDGTGSPITGLSYTWTLSAPARGNITKLSADEIEFQAISEGITDIIAETIYNGTAQKGVSTITIISAVLEFTGNYPLLITVPVIVIIFRLTFRFTKRNKGC